MKIALGRILNSVEGLKKLVNEQLPVKTAYRLKRIMDAVVSENTRIEKSRVELIKKYADVQTEEQIKKGESIKVTTNLPLFQKDFLSLLEEVVELNCYKIPFSDIENIKISVNELTSLEPWFDGIPAELTAEIVSVPEPKKQVPEVEEGEIIEVEEVERPDQSEAPEVV